MNPICKLTFGLCATACFFAPQVSAAGTPATVTLGDLVQTYDGTPKIVSVATQPANLPVQLVYRNLSPTAPTSVSQVVYNDTPDPLALSYFSYSFHAQQLSALGNLIQLGGTARKLESCDAILVTWAKAADWPALAAANPAGYIHPITLTFYEVTSTNQLIFRTEATQNVLIPWRPLVQSNGTPWPPSYNGYAFRANILFTNGITLPERVLVMVSFNTQNSGFAPIGSSGPYDSLNVAYKSNNSNVAPVGADVNTDVVLQVKSGTWYYPSTGWTTSSAPLLRLNALSTETITPPTNAGPWQASARVSNADYLGTASSLFTIQPAVASVVLSNLSQTVDGNPKSVTVTTNPPNLAVNVTYNGSPSPPIAPGTYAVHAVIANPNYLGIADGQLSLLGQTFNSWITPWVTNLQIPGSGTGSNDDPDQDSITNLLEYALALDPSMANHGLPDFGLPHLDYSSSQLSLVFRKNLAATDLEFQVESSTLLDGPEGWSPAATTNEIVATVGLAQIIRASLTIPPNQPQLFLRLRVKHQN